MRIIKRKLNINDASNALLVITIITSSVLLFSAFFGKAEYFGWGALYFVLPLIISFYGLVALFILLLFYNVIYKWLLHQWPTSTLVAQGIIIIVFVMLDNAG